MDFYQFRKYKDFLFRLKHLSDFDDDGLFLVRIKTKDLDFKEKVKAPSRHVLESAILRLSSGEIDDNEVEIKKL